MEDLSDIAEELVVYLRFHIAAAQDSPDPDAIAVAADSACTYFQGVGICELLLDAEIDAFFHYMIRSARSRKWLLKRARAEAGFPVKPMRASNTKGLFAALVANDWNLAKEIAELSVDHWLVHMEYEEDFWYAHFLHRFLAGDAEHSLKSVLAEYGRALEGDEPPRFRLCDALLSAASESASEAFVALVDERIKELDTLRKTSILATDDLFPPFAAIYVEGLAWLRILTRAGLPTESEYPLCPSLARATEYAPFVPDGLLDA